MKNRNKENESNNDNNDKKDVPKKDIRNISDLLKEMSVEPKKDTRYISDLLKEMGAEPNKDKNKKWNITFETLEKLNKKLFRPFNSEHNGDNSEGSENNSGKINISSELLQKINESKELVKKIKKYDENKKYASADEVLKKLNARSENDRKVNEVLKKYYEEESQRASERVEKFNKTINDNPDMSSEKSEIINKLIDLYGLIQIYYFNKIDNNSKANEKIDDVSVSREINELEKRLRDQRGSGMFTSQKEFPKLLTFLARLHAGNNYKKLKNDINRLLKALYNSKQISKLVYKNLITAI